VSADTLLEADIDVAPVHTSAIARFFNERIYVVNRSGADNIQVLEPASGFTTIEQFSVGAGSDPRDIVFDTRTRAFVSRYGADQLWIVDTNQGTRRGLIDFSWLADADGIPEMQHMLKIGGRVFVSIQRLDQNTDGGPVGTSYLAVFNANTELFIDADPVMAGVQALLLAGTHPYGELILNPESGLIWVANVGRFGINDAGLELVDPDALTTSGIVLTEAVAGGDIIDVVPIDENRGAAIVTDASSNSLLIGFDLSTPASIDTIYAPGAPTLGDAEMSKDARLFLSDRAPGLPGIRVYRVDSFTEITTSPVDVGLPPADIQFAR
jgi:DNA-binding beta-propeller fold protein YncE